MEVPETRRERAASEIRRELPRDPKTQANGFYDGRRGGQVRPQKNRNFRPDPTQNTGAQATAHMLLECTNRLDAFGKTIKDATDFFIQHLTANEKSCTARELVDEFIAAKQEEAVSQFHLDDLRAHLTIFGKKFGGNPVRTITGAQIDDWLRSLNVSIVTRNHYRRLIMLAFNFAVQRGHTQSNPVFGRFVVSRPV
jgi:hypothetical protein